MTDPEPGTLWADPITNVEYMAVNHGAFVCAESGSNGLTPGDPLINELVPVKEATK